MKQLICIRCPRGCQLEVDENILPLSVRGNACRRGEEFAHDELHDPRRFLCSSVAVAHGCSRLVSVWTAAAIPKDLVLPLAAFLRGIVVEAPIALDQVIMENALGSGVAVIASMAVERVESSLSER